ncbi:MAG: HAD family hydrolase [Sphingomonas sp.]
MHRIALYDMDKTITRAPTWTSFLLRYAASEAPWRLALLPVAGVVAFGYAVRLLNRAQLKEAAHWLMIGPRTAPATLARPAGRFAASLVANGLFADALTQIAADRAAGYRIVLATASHHFYVDEIARALGIADVVATAAQIDRDGWVLWRLDGDNCYGAAKLAKVEAWLAGQGVARNMAAVRFYSDHVSDTPTLDWADEGFVINADTALLALAKTMGWCALVWR